MTHVTTPGSHALTFQSTTFDVIDRDGQPWLKASDIARALGYSRADKIARLHDRNSAEFTDNMTAIVDTPTSGVSGNLVTQTRIFSLRGAHLLGMFARTKIAAAFRKWVLDILDRLDPDSAPEIVLTPSPNRPDYSMAAGQKLTKDQTEELRLMLESTVVLLPEDKRAGYMISGWSKLKAHFGVMYRQIPQEHFLEAKNILARHYAEHSTPAKLPSPTGTQRLLLTLTGDSKTVEPVADDALMVSITELCKQLEEKKIATEDALKLMNASVLHLFCETLQAKTKTLDAITAGLRDMSALEVQEIAKAAFFNLTVRGTRLTLAA